MIIELFIPGIPKPKQSMRTGVVYNRSTGDPIIYRNKNTGRRQVLTQQYQKKEVKENERSIQLVAKEQLPPGFTPTDKPIIVTRLIYSFPPIKSLNKAQRQAIEEGHVVLKHTKPDLTDNLSKGLFDALQGIVYMNDSQICEMSEVWKEYSSRPGTTVHFRILEKDDSLIRYLDTERAEGRVEKI